MSPYNNRAVLVTGHTGFKGAWLSCWLHQLGAKITGVAQPPHTQPNLFDCLNLATKIQHHVADIRELTTLKNIVQKAQPEIIFHLAAQALVGESYQNPKETFEINTMGLINLLEVARTTPSIKAIIIVTSDKCYRIKDALHFYNETDALGGHDPYSASKGCQELIAASYSHSFLQDLNINIATARAGNVIGGGDWAKNRLVPDCIHALSLDQPITIKNPHHVRPWQHVLEPLWGYLLLGEARLGQNQNYSIAWNFGPSTDQVLTVNEMVHSLIDCWGKGEIIITNEKAFNETPILHLDSTKAKNELNWTCQYGIEETLQLTCDWYKAWHEKSTDLYDLTVQQINNYMEKVTPI